MISNPIMAENQNIEYIQMTNSMSDLDNTLSKSQTRTKMMKIGIIASILLLADILLFWYDDIIGFIITIYFFWIAIPALVVFLIAFFKSFKWKTRWHKVMFGCGLSVIILFALYQLVRAPKQSCDPDIMAKHYEEHKTEMVELHDYMQSVLADSAAVILEFKGNRLEKFHISPPDSDRFSNFWDDDARAKCDSLMSVVGLTEEEYKGIRNRLKSIGCIGIKASRTSPETTEIWFRHDGIGLYSYFLSTCPFNSDEKEEIMKNLSICPYNEHVLFEYAGAAFVSDNFPQRDEYLKKHQPW